MESNSSRTFTPTRLRPLAVFVSSSHTTTNIDHTSIKLSALLAAEKQSEHIRTERGGSSFHREPFPYKERGLCTSDVFHVTTASTLNKGAESLL